MSEEKMMRLGQIARKLNVGTATIVESLAKKGYEVENNPNSKITLDQVSMLEKEFKSSALEKEEASHLSIGKRHEPTASEQDLPKQEKVVEPTPVPAPAQETQVTPAPVAKAPEPQVEKIASEAPKLEGIRVLGKVDLSKKPTPTPPSPQPKPTSAPIKEEKKPDPVAPVVSTPPTEPTPTAAPAEVDFPSPSIEFEVIPEELISAKADSLKGLTVLGKIELPTDRSKKKGGPVASSDERGKDKKRPRKRIDSKPGAPNPAGQAPTPQNRPQEQRSARPGQPSRPGQPARPGQPRPAGGSPQQRIQKAEPTPKEIQDQIKQTLARLQGNKPGGKTKSRRDKRAERDRDVETDGDEVKILKVTEFISANDLAALLDVSVNQIISACLSLGMFVSINQRLDAEAITIIADEFGFDVEFTKSIEDEMEEEVPDTEEELLERAPIVTIMGHVDHGKTSLLDFIRMSKVTAAEAGGITQHIGAYDVRTKTGNKIAFLDTPGHEAFTAMRARGAKITDVAIIVIAADDSIMPQTKEAINHAQVAGVPMIFAINKVDKPNARPEKIKEELANMNLLVEDWGGKYQSQEISAKTGQGIDELLEKVLLESEILELKANPNKNAVGTVIEASLDKGRGYVSTVMVQAGTLRIGDVLLAGQHYGRVKAMFDHKGNKLKEAGPSTPVQMLGLSGAPQAGDTIKVYDTEREAREIANSREQIQREQSLRTKKHITLDEIGRRLAIGSFKELNIIIKGDVDGSVEALSDSLLKLSKDEVKVSIIHKGVGQISESDVLLASASD
ncbi:MAG: hypothetical protein RLZZ207_1884, partial [Bacteroidota bacterium]